MTELFYPEVIALTAMLTGLCIGWLARCYAVTSNAGDADEVEVDRQAWIGVRDVDGKFVKLI